MDIFGAISLKKQRKLIYNLAEKFDHIKLLGPEDYNILPYYKVSDVLLTEASSTIYEMIALSKPVVVNRFYKLKLSHRLFANRLYNRRLSKKMNQEEKLDLKTSLNEAFDEYRYMSRSPFSKKF